MKPLPALLIALTFTTGLIDAVSILGLGRIFTALMTGNVVFVGLSLADPSEPSAARPLLGLAAFGVGAIAGGRLAKWRAPISLGAWLLSAAAAETALLVAAAVLAPNAPTVTGTALYGIIISTAAAMGLRSATVVRIADPDLKTTVLTLTITAIAADSVIAGGDGRQWGRRALSILVLMAGAWAGAESLARFGMRATFVAMAAIVMGATAWFATRAEARAVASG